MQIRSESSFDYVKRDMMSYEVWFKILKSRDLFGENIVAARLGGRF